MNTLKGKVALITGGAKGIGQAIVTRLANDGAKVVINYRHSKDSATQLVTALSNENLSAIAIQADVGQRDQVNSLYQQTLNHFGRIDILVNNAALSLEKKFVETSEEEFDTLFSANVKGPFLMMQRAFQHMQRGGKIINICSTVLDLLVPNYSLYSATKGALHMFTRALVQEAAELGITINAVSPGATKTDMLMSTTDEKFRQQIAKLSALKRIGEVEDIANIVAFFASEDSNWITGQNLRANGGWT